MKKYFVLLILAVLALILQTTLFHELALAGAKPDLVLILIIFMAIICGPQKGGITGFLLGLLEDLYLGRFIGMNCLSKGLTGITAGLLTLGAFSENLLVPIITVFLGTLLNGFIYFFLGMLLGMKWTLELFLWKSIPLAIYNMCLVPFIYSRFYYFAQGFNNSIISSDFWQRLS